MKTNSLPNFIFKFSVAIGSILLTVNDILYVWAAVTGRTVVTPIILLGIVLDTISAVFFAYLFFNPGKVRYYAFMCFAHAAFMLIIEPENLLGIFSYLLGIVILIDAKFFRTHLKTKTAIFTLIYFGLLLSELRFGFDNFINYLMHKIGITLMTLVMFMILFRYIRDNYIPIQHNVLDLTKFPELTQRDKEWIIKVLENAKYDSIAREYNLNLGTVKNHFRKLYKILNVDDRQGFLTEYAGATVLCTEKEVQLYSETHTH